MATGSENSRENLGELEEPRGGYKNVDTEQTVVLRLDNHRISAKVGFCFRTDTATAFAKVQNMTKYSHSSRVQC